MCGCLSCGPQWGLACNPGMCPDWESNQQPFGSQPTLNPLSYSSQGSMAVLRSCSGMQCWLMLPSKGLTATAGPCVCKITKCRLRRGGHRHSNLMWNLNSRVWPFNSQFIKLWFTCRKLCTFNICHLVSLELNMCPSNHHIIYAINWVCDLWEGFIQIWIYIRKILPWLVWFSGLMSISRRTKRSLVWFPVRAHALVCWPAPWLGACKEQPTNVSLLYISLYLSPSRPLSLKINKIF